MKFTSTLFKGKLVKRYKRFFVDIKANNQIVAAHCPNTGSMKGLLVALLGLPDDAMDIFQIDNCSVTTVEIRDGINILTMLNHTAHLV